MDKSYFQGKWKAGRVTYIHRIMYLLTSAYMTRKPFVFIYIITYIESKDNRAWVWDWLTNERSERYSYRGGI